MFGALILFFNELSCFIYNIEKLSAYRYYELLQRKCYLIHRKRELRWF